MSLEDKVKETLDTIRPQLQADGGDLEYVKMEEGKVYEMDTCLFVHN